jgi:NAD(P)-dependent dehydrogenase (short-subunit alcohol dehydrogenase family)
MTSRTFDGLPGGALVTGGTGGIGRAIVQQLVREGSAVTFTFRSSAAAAVEMVTALQAEGHSIAAIELDLADADHCARVVEVAANNFGGLHTVVHASGPHVRQVHLSKVAPADFARQVEGEISDTFNLLQPALPHLRASKGSIVAVTTAATARYPVRDGLSAAPKAAVEQLILGLAVEEGRFGVRANCVGPGMLTDGMAERLMASGDLDDEALAVTKANIPLRRFGRATDIAEAVCFLASQKANFITGQLLRVDGGYSV